MMPEAVLAAIVFMIGNLPEEHQKDIIDEAMELARSPEARGMPGYNGPG